MSKKEITCKYFMNGACNKGNDCEFSHDLQNSKSNMICTFYKKGQCTYGDRCRYDHVKQRPPPSVSPADDTNRASSAGASVPRSGPKKENA
ncbi:probable E3 ubiquitin-protein ligase makorin-2 [Sinocyclocheilus rhinocerous]|uniref:probable E3 ubiquitin-protein ligase makorin-2 n=1 Tax=Sinocyclocheilus rhinocerous TaxID=307959 RepID=UPI0007B8A77F|nr:PREDICTED: probable E3 ubiquitin-protein ligase makorin-2 [Sinocyclocheilus rhinocerous]